MVIGSGASVPVLFGFSSLARFGLFGPSRRVEKADGQAMLPELHGQPRILVAAVDVVRICGDWQVMIGCPLSDAVQDRRVVPLE